MVVKCLPHKHEDPSSDLRHPQKCAREMETSRSLCSWLVLRSCLIGEFDNREQPCLNKLPFDLHIHILIHVCMSIHVHTHTPRGSRVPGSAHTAHRALSETVKSFTNFRTTPTGTSIFPLIRHLCLSQSVLPWVQLLPCPLSVLSLRHSALHPE